MIAGLLLALSWPSAAGTITGRFVVSPRQGELAVSRDGYHAAVMSVGEGQREVWTVDGRVVGTYPKGNTVIRPPVVEAALSNDGKRFAVAVAVFEVEGGFPVGQAVYLNGKPLKRYNEIKDLSFAPHGAGLLNYKARRDRAWAVVVENREGPLLEPEPGPPVFFKDGRFAYVTLGQGAYALTIDHEPVQGWTGMELFADPAGKKKVSVVRRNFVNAGGKLLGPFGDVKGVAVSPDGARVAVKADEDGGRSQQVYVEDVPAGSRLTAVTDMAFSPAGPLYWFSPAGLGEALYRDGVLLVSTPGFVGAPRLAFTPKGRVAVAALAAEGFMDVYIENSKVLSGVRRLAKGAGLVFESENELHWLSVEPQGVVLNCAELSPSGAPSACVTQATARSLQPAK